MDIRYLSRRNHELTAKNDMAEARRTADAAGLAQAAQATQANTSTSAQGVAPAAAEEATRQPAALSRFTPTGRLLHVLQTFESRHPEQTQRVLSNIADKLRTDAEHAGVFSERLTRWADRFQEAADSGDMSKLMPRLSPHFGARAYQQAEQAESDATIEHVAGTAEAQSDAAVSDAVNTPPVTVSEADSAPAERVSGIHERPVTVPESAASERASADIRNRPVTVPESSKLAVNE